jgi:Ca2+-binding RTX toxin-like protein
MVSIIFTGTSAGTFGTSLAGLDAVSLLGGSGFSSGTVTDITFFNATTGPDRQKVIFQTYGVTPTTSIAYRFEAFAGPADTRYLQVNGLSHLLPYGFQNYLDPAGLPAVRALLSQIFMGSDTFDVSGTVSSIWGDKATLDAGAGPTVFGNDSIYLHNLTLAAGMTSIVITGDAMTAAAGSQFVAGNDTISVLSFPGVPMTIYGDFVSADGVGTFGSDAIVGGNVGDMLYGDSAGSFVSGGNDFIDGRNGADQIFGGGGDDTLLGGFGTDTLDGGEGNDSLHGQINPDVLIGGNGFDLARYDLGQFSVTASLADPSANTGDALGDSFFSIEGLVGSNGGDVLVGNSTDNVIRWPWRPRYAERTGRERCVGGGRWQRLPVRRKRQRRALWRSGFRHRALR